MLRKFALSLAALGAVGAAALGGVGVAQAAPATPVAHPVAAPAGGILDSGINFSEPKGSQGIGGDGGECITVTLPTTGSLQHFDGTLTFWTGSDCKRGKSLVVDKNEANLTKLGFGKTKSIFIGDNHRR
ncbi:hypothetical protein GCM10010464_15520 [Pseudonocardia yunnanensis]|uniref:Uncharacterized protein n=1 Tax=Pseudonocardia yunnanensis TaxID=58107 RepID=A0ABW4EVZ8_9PSEU